MVPLYAAPVLTVEQPRRLFASGGRYQVFDGAGAPVATVAEHRSAWSGWSGKSRPHRFSVYGVRGDELMVIDKPWRMGKPHIHVWAMGHFIGTIVQGRSLLGSQFRIKDPHGHTVGEISGNWTGWDFRVQLHGAEAARINKRHTGLRGAWFGTEDRYAVEFAGQLHPAMRKLVVAAAVTVDVLLHEREPDYYYSSSRYDRRHRHHHYGHHQHHPNHQWHRHDRAERRAARRNDRKDGGGARSAPNPPQAAAGTLGSRTGPARSKGGTAGAAKPSGARKGGFLSGLLGGSSSSGGIGSSARAGGAKSGGGKSGGKGGKGGARKASASRSGGASRKGANRKSAGRSGSARRSAPRKSSGRRGGGSRGRKR